MNTHRRSRMAPRNGSEAGFTFVEVIISVVILTMITGALSGAFVASLKASKVSGERVHESNDAQLIAAYFNRDAQATGGGPGTAALSSSPAISTTDAAGCVAPGGGSLVVRFEWIDPSSSTTHIATYFTQPLTTTTGASQLIRTTCVTSGVSTTTSSLTLANRVTTSPAPVAWCDNNAPGSCPVTFPITLPNTVSMRVTELNVPVVANAQNTFTLTAKVRPQTPTFDAAIPTPLVVLGRSGCGSSSDSTTGLAVGSFTGLLAPLLALFGISPPPTLQVAGRTYINALDNGGSCPAMNLQVGAQIQSGITSMVNGGTCDGSWVQPCPTAPFLSKNNPPINDPYASLATQLPNAAALGLTPKSGGCSGPGVYASTMSISSGSCTLASGVYILHGGISISGGASVTSAPGGVLLYIDNGGGFDASGAGSINLTGLTPSGPNAAAQAPYAGLVIWKSDALSTVNCSEFLNITSNTAGVCFEGQGNSDAHLQGVIYSPQSPVSDQLTLANVAVTGVVAQAVIADSLGAMTVGTPGPSPIISTLTLPSPWTVNQPYPTTTLAATAGTAPYWWQLIGGTSLPPGLTLDGSTGTISGTPTATGTTTFKISATDILGESTSRTYSITINQSPTITTTPPDWTVTFDYKNFPMHASGGTGPFTWSAIGLPTGLTIAAGSGVISGTPTVVGTFNPTITLKDATGAVTTSNPTVVIHNLPTITGPPSLPSPWTANNTYPTTQITTSDGTPAFTWAASGLPPGLQINSSGQIFGTPTTAGTYSTVTVTATDKAGAAATQTYSIVVNGPLGLGGSLPNGEINQPYNPPSGFTIPSSGGTPPYTFSIAVGALPAGLTLSPGGVVSGTPTAAGSSTLTIKVADSTGASTTKQYTIQIVAAPTITNTSLPNWTINRDYPGTQIQATGGIAPFTYSATGLPPGLAISPGGPLQPGGLITGTPTTTGTYTVVVTLTDGTGFQTTKSFQITINGPPSITTTSLPDGETTVGYSTTMAGTGGTIPYSWTTASPLPDGLTMSSAGVISGTPTASGTYSVNITMVDAAGASASLPFTLTIAQGPQMGVATPPNGEVGVAYPGITFTGSSGAPPYTFTVNNGLPPGLSLSGGAITGNPTTPGTYSNVQITIHDSKGGTQTTTYTIVITPAPTIPTTSLPNGMLTTPYSAAVAVSGGTAPYTWTTTGTLPPGLTFNTNTGAWTGTPTAIGTYPVTYTVTDALGASVSKSLTIKVTQLATVGAITPNNLPVGVSNRTVTIAGTNFVAGATANFGGNGVTVTPVSVTPTLITVRLTISSSATTGVRNVVVTNGDGSTASGGAGGFTVNPLPTITSAGPTGHRNTNNVSVTIVGTGFQAGATVTISDNGFNATVVAGSQTTTSTQITLKINIPNHTGTYDVSVTNPDGGSVTKTNIYTVTN